MGQVQINGVQLGVEIREAAASKTTLVMVHGFTGSAAGWGSHLDVFAQVGMRIIALDMLGHGQSDAPGDAQRYSIERCREDIIAALSILGVQQGEAVLLGYSMGGRIALYTAFSGFFRALILESASPGIEDPNERTQRRISDEALAARIEREGIASFVEYWEHMPLFASQQALPDEVRRSLRAQRLCNRAVGLAQSLRGVGTGVQPSLYERLTSLHMPVLLLTGELDKKFTAIAQHMKRLLPQATLHIVPGAGHAVHLEQPMVFQQHVKAFCCTEEPYFS
jgi:2-succinyl-6-hydroxy-2,4-cyclohexadiene-1-carboxylate synthase